MRKAIVIILLPLLLSVAVINPSAQTKQKAKQPKPDPYLVPLESPCGIPVPRYDEYLEELKVEWRGIAENDQTTWYYNTRRQVCEKGILKVWTKSVEKQNLAYAIDRLEINCRSNQTRLTSSIKYKNDGSVLD